jgi:hypothetical protein
MPLGEEAGFLLNGYRRITLDGVAYPAARIAYALGYGELPPEDIPVEHLNRVRDDNRKENLSLPGFREVGMSKRLLAKIKARDKFLARRGLAPLGQPLPEQPETEQPEYPWL